MRALRLKGALAAVVLCAGHATAGATDLSVPGYPHEHKTLATSDPEGFGREGKPREIEAELLLPNGAGPFAAVIVFPGSDGLSAAKEGAYATHLLQYGIAVLVIDPLRARGLDDLLRDPAALSDAAMVEDVRAGLDLLAHDPRIDAARIGGLGTSRGASVLMASAARLKPQSFRALALVYPYCAHDWRLGTGLKAPQVLMLLAGKEDEVSNEACMDLAKLYVADDIALTLEVLPGAFHGFDSGMPGVEALLVSAKACPLVPVQPDGTFLTLVISGAPTTAATTVDLVAAMRRCLIHGIAHWGETPGSRGYALARVTAFLSQALHTGSSAGPHLQTGWSQ
ncbi:MAG TPA: dienelactone hydrolase family protein [Hyphomicrobium sp.]|nr:dienelactone hydrolase family protein [Hyphomicrobium sp.]